MLVHVEQLADRVLPGWILLLLLLLSATVACSARSELTDADGLQETAAGQPDSLDLPEFEAIPAGDGPVRIVATTGIIGDIVSQIAGQSAAVSVLMAPNQDPHGYQSTARDLRLAADADVIFVNGWGLEEGLIEDLINAAGSATLVPLSAGVEPRYFDDEPGAGRQEGNELRIDPHAWLVPANVITWVKNIEAVLSALEPGNAEAYAERAQVYENELGVLSDYYEQRLAPVDLRDRVLVTNHDAFGYFADAYEFEVVGTIVPGDSTLSEPSSRDLAMLLQSMREARICAIFIERSASQQLAEQLAGELDHCETVKIVPLYSGALGEEGSGAETYLQMMRANIDVIADSLPHGASESDEGSN
jgi:ABC-type Zn uptake system ZnuABC Zn-binding protein ZnuA